MKVHIGKYTSWFGPYQLARVLCFWAKPIKDEYGYLDTPKWVHKFGEWLAHGSVEKEPFTGDIRDLNVKRNITLLYKFLLWVDSKKKRKVKVRVDNYDIWSMDHTLALIILPMLEKLKSTHHGAPYVDDEDVPENIRSTSAPTKEYEYDVDDFHFARWKWVLDEIIFAFYNTVHDDWEEQFTVGNYDLKSKKTEDNLYEIIHGEKHTAVFNKEEYKAYADRIQNGYRLFGKYYSGLWT